jgi:hypothetical protein
MSTHIELLASKGNGGQQFTVDTTPGVLSVPIATHGSFECDNVDAKSLFQPGDNMQIIAAGINLPENFCFANVGFGGAPLAVLPKINMYFYTEPGHVKYYPSIAGSNGSFFVPFENFEYIVNNYIDVVAGTFITNLAPPNDISIGIPQKFAVYLSVDPGSCKISMVNVPAILNGQVERITPFIKVLHNLPLIT